KHSKPVLKTFPTTGPQVVQGPGENAGVLRLHDGWAVAFKIESHNHPSAVEPYQGAATGAGGILRDVFTMGARPVALLNSLRFGGADTRERASPPTGSSGRSVHREAPARGESRADRVRPHRGDSGYGGGGAHVVVRRDGGARWRRRRDRSLEGPHARARHDTLRDPSFRIAGAHVGDREGRPRKGGAGDRREVGARRNPYRSCDRRRHVSLSVAGESRRRNPGSTARRGLSSLFSGRQGRSAER